MKIELYVQVPPTTLIDLSKYGMDDKTWNSLDRKRKIDFIQVFILPAVIDFRFFETFL